MKKHKYPGIAYMIKIICLALIVSFVIIVARIKTIQLYSDGTIDDFILFENEREEIIDFFQENKDIIKESILNNDLKRIRKFKEVESVVDLSDENDKHIKIQCYYEGFASVSTECGIIYFTNPNTDLFLGDWINDYKKKPSGDGIKYIDLMSDNDLYIEKLGDNYYYYQQDY